MQNALKKLEQIKRKQEIDQVVNGDHDDFSEGTERLLEDLNNLE